MFTSLRLSGIGRVFLSQSRFISDEDYTTAIKRLCERDAALQQRIRVFRWLTVWSFRFATQISTYFLLDLWHFEGYGEEGGLMVVWKDNVDDEPEIFPAFGKHKASFRVYANRIRVGNLGSGAVGVAAFFFHKNTFVKKWGRFAPLPPNFLKINRKQELRV